jgi:hypothetical protein
MGPTDCFYRAGPTPMCCYEELKEHYPFFFSFFVFLKKKREKKKAEYRD